MSKTQNRAEPDASNLSWTNGTAAAVVAGQVVIVRGEAFVAETAIAIGASGALNGTGEHYLTAASGDTWAQGQALGWDRTNSRLTTDLTGGIFFTATVAKVSGTTKSLVRINKRRKGLIRKTLAGGDINTDTCTFSTALGFTPQVTGIRVLRSNVPRLPATYVWGGTDSDVLSVTGGAAGAALASGDIVEITYDY